MAQRRPTGRKPASRRTPRKRAAGDFRLEDTAALAAPAGAPLDLRPAPPPVLGDIPWGYGADRVTAMARDPYWLFVYWELTDEAIARARAEVQAPGAGCVLRAYDTTYRLFDGTNANWYMDVPIDRPANNHHVLVNRPGATLHVDIGVKSHEGYFAKIVRSAPVEMPRDSISSDTRVEWMTVVARGAPGRPYEHRFVPEPASTPRTVIEARDLETERVMQALVGEGWSRSEWSETVMGGRTVRWLRRTEPLAREGWHVIGAGGWARIEILFEGGRRIVRTAQGERAIVGPWHVTIRGLAPDGRVRLVDRWTIHYAWTAAEGRVRIETAPIVRRILRGYRRAGAAGGSEARLLEASGASEALQLGASEWRWVGASERWLGGASETGFLGASERRYLGASEVPFLAASESLLAGASEALGARGILGGSDWLAAGASEGWPSPTGTGP